MAGDVALRHPVTPQGCGDVAGVGRHDGFEPIGLCGRVLGGCPRSLVVLLQNRNRRVTLLGERDDVDEQIAALLGVGEQLGGSPPRLLHALCSSPMTSVDWAAGVRSEAASSAASSAARDGPEVGAVADEHCDPLLASVIDGGGDEVGDVETRGRGSCRRRPRTRWCVRRSASSARIVVPSPWAPWTVRGVGELDVITRIVRGQNALSVLPRRR